MFLAALQNRPQGEQPSDTALMERQQRAIELAFFEGMTHSEICQAMQEPLGTVKSWIRNGLLRLHEALEGAR